MQPPPGRACAPGSRAGSPKQRPADELAEAAAGEASADAAASKGLDLSRPPAPWPCDGASSPSFSPPLPPLRRAGRLSNMQTYCTRRARPVSQEDFPSGKRYGGAGRGSPAPRECRRTHWGSASGLPCGSLGAAAPPPIKAPGGCGESPRPPGAKLRRRGETCDATARLPDGASSARQMRLARAAKTACAPKRSDRCGPFRLVRSDGAQGRVCYIVRLPETWLDIRTKTPWLKLQTCSYPCVYFSGLKIPECCIQDLVDSMKGTNH